MSRFRGRRTAATAAIVAAIAGAALAGPSRSLAADPVEPQLCRGRDDLSGRTARCATAPRAWAQPSLAPPLTSYPARYATIAEGRRQLAITVLNGMFGGIDVDVEALRFQNAGFLAAR